MVEDRARWMAELLATSFQVSGLSEEELERRLGWSSGSVGRLLEGDSDLDAEQVLQVLTELNGDSSWEAGPEDEWEDERTQVVTDLVERFRRLGYEKVELPQETAVDLADLEERVESILRKAFGDSFDNEPPGEED